VAALAGVGSTAAHGESPVTGVTAISREFISDPNSTI
jgi:hypothetical protein